ncbi:MAG TPA: DNA polymerase [Jatrophihabitans sp.]|uniref:DNA polymerase n=1 Tax=Jatrophihabitans sp. TaxID=1932789 RepID=UPI002EE81F70
MPHQLETADGLLSELRRRGQARGGFLALSLAPERGLGIAEPGGGQWAVASTEPAAVVATLEREFRPRWVWWSQHTPIALTHHGVRVATCWDLVAVHRLLFGGWSSDPALIWATLHDLDPASAPGTGQLDLFGDAGDEGTDPEDPVRPDQHLRPEWSGGGWARTPARLARWAQTALRASELQRQRLAAAPAAGDVLATARSESAAELLCAELTVDGLPIDLARAEQIIASFAGPRPRDAQDAGLLRERRDSVVLRLLPNPDGIDLRNPAQVRTMLARVGIDVPDTRSWRLERFLGAHPVVEALLAWRKAERIATTFGYDWLARNVGPDARLRGAWSGSDGAAGRMTAQAGLHNMPADLRPAVAATAGQVFVRADLGQIEPRVLAAVSGDRSLARATQDDDLYAPVASRLGVDRPTAKIAVLAAMYGQTSGAAGQALQGLESAYPVAMRYLREAYDSGRAGRAVRTYGGRLVRMWPTPPNLNPDQERATVASRGRYARNAVIQGAAAELFKAWAVTVRARGLPWQAQVVLCLHDELLVQAPAEHGPAVRQLLTDCLQEAAARWAPDDSVRFVADVSVIRRWSEAKE